MLLLEAGPGNAHPLLHIPAGWASNFRNPRVDWGFSTEPEPALNGRSIYWPRGKVLGGSSAINGMIYVRGVPLDFDRWAQAGARGWSYEEVLPYFRKAERQQRVQDDMDLARAIGVGGTPAFFFNGREVTERRSAALFTKLLEKAEAEADWRFSWGLEAPPPGAKAPETIEEPPGEGEPAEESP